MNESEYVALLADMSDEELFNELALYVDPLAEERNKQNQIEAMQDTLQMGYKILRVCEAS